MEHEMIPVPRAELLAWAKAWLHDYDPNDGTDCVTPFDTYLLKSPVEAQPVAWDVFDKEGNLIAGRVSKADADEIASRWEYEGSRISPLYAHPPPSAPVGVEGVEAALQKWLDWCNEHNEEPEARAGARIAVEALAQQTTPDTTKPRPTIVLHVDTDGGLHFTSSEDVDVLVIDYGADLDYYEDDEITKVEQAIGPRADAVVYFAAVDTKPAYTKYRVNTYRATDGRNC